MNDFLKRADLQIDAIHEIATKCNISIEDRAKALKAYHSVQVFNICLGSTIQEIKTQFARLKGTWNS